MRASAWWYSVDCAVRMVALIKKEVPDGEVPDVRPVGMGNCRRRAWTSLLVKQRADAIGGLGKHQVAVGVRAGLSKLHLVLSQHEEKHPDFVTLKLDCKNAHNSVTRAAVLLRLIASPVEAIRELALAFGSPCRRHPAYGASTACRKRGPRVTASPALFYGCNPPQPRGCSSFHRTAWRHHRELFRRRSTFVHRRSLHSLSR